jgi:magnesium transporter
MPAKRTRSPAWEPGTAGYEMTDAFPVARSGQSVKHVQEMLRKGVHSFDTIIYIYTIDDEGHLIGVLSIQELFGKKPSADIAKVCNRKDLAVAHPWSRREKIAYLALRRNVKAVPVTDKDGVLLGVVPPDALLRILHREMHEDVLHMAGIHHRGVHNEQAFDNILNISVWSSLKHRFPWLLLGLFGGLFAASVIDFFETTLRNHIVLAAFIPLIVYMSDAVGTQMEAFIIRDLAMDRRLRFGPYFFRQFLIVTALALLFGGIVFCATLLLYGDIGIAYVIALSLIAAIISSVFTGLLIPYFFSRMRLDPANASGPTATIIQDLTTIIIYFMVATALL